MSRLTWLVLIIACTANLGFAQSFIPKRSGAVLIGDRFGDRIWALNDFNFDTDTHDAGECVQWYTGLNGPVLATIQDIAIAPNGVALVADSTGDIILSLIDLNLDGDADDVGESSVFFDLSNASGIQAGSMMGLTITGSNPPQVIVANSSNSAAPQDMVLILEDLNSDGDAQDAGEARIFWEKSVSMLSGGPDLDIPASVIALSGGQIAVLHGAGAASTAPKGIYTLADLNGDGDANDLGEVSRYYLLPATTTPVSFDMTESRDGGIYVVDRGLADTIYKLNDLDGNGTISGPGEATPFWTATGSSLIDNMCEAVGFDGRTSLLVAEDSTPDRMLGLVDLNGDGVINNNTEEFTIHDTGIASVVDFGQPKAVECLPAPFLDGPATVNIGGNFTTSHESVAGHSLFIGFSPVVPSIFAPPYGIYHLGTFPPPVLSVPSALVPGNGIFQIATTVPSSGVLSGLVLNIQSYDFDGFFGRLSNLYQLTIL